MEDQISASLSYDQVQELKSIDPDSWQNIPPPIKSSVSLLISQLLYLSNEQSQMRKTMKNEIDVTNTRLRKMRKELETEVERLDETKKQIREELTRVQKETSTSLCDSEHGLKDFLTSQDAVKETQFHAFEEQQNLLRIRLKQVQGNMEDLKVSFQTQIQTLAKSIPPQLGKLRKEITAETALELNSVKENAQNIDIAWQQADRKMSEQVKKWTVEFIDQAKAESDSVKSALEALKTAFMEQKQEIETQNSGFVKKITEVQEGIYAKLREVDTLLDEKCNQSASVFTNFHTEFLTFVTDAEKEKVVLRDCIKDATIQGEVAIQRIKTEFQEETSVLTDKLETRMHFLLSDVQELCNHLDQKITKECEKMFETQIREVKTKLAVPFI